MKNLHSISPYVELTPDQKLAIIAWFKQKRFGDEGRTKFINGQPYMRLSSGWRRFTNTNMWAWTVSAKIQKIKVSEFRPEMIFIENE